MIEDYNSIVQRVQQIQQKIAELSPSTAASAPPAGRSTFVEHLNDATSAISSPSSLNPVLQAVSLGGRQIEVPPASLGPLPTLPIVPAAISGDESTIGTANYGQLVAKYAEENGISPALVQAVIQTESGGNPRAVSHAGAMGLMQLMPANVHEAGVNDPFDPEQNIRAGAKQLGNLVKQYHGDLNLALAAYNAGPGAVRKYGGVPPFHETQNYIVKVKSAMNNVENR